MDRIRNGRNHSTTAMALSVEAVSAIEDAFLRGEWTQALSDSRSILAARIVSRQNLTDLAVLTMEEERVLSVYLQTIFELNLDDEVETVVTFAKLFTPLPSGIAAQYCNFLMAMNRRPVAKQALQDLLELFARNKGLDARTEQYIKAAETMALHLLLPDEGIKAARQFVAEDEVLDDKVKLQLLHRIHTMHLASQEASKDSLPTLSVNQTVQTASGNPPLMSDATYQSVSAAFTGTQQPTTKQDDDSNSYVVIGTTALALAAAAVGVVRYREKMYKCVSHAIPAIAKSVADAKLAIFEA